MERIPAAMESTAGSATEGIAATMEGVTAVEASPRMDSWAASEAAVATEITATTEAAIAAEATVATETTVAPEVSVTTEPSTPSTAEPGASADKDTAREILWAVETIRRTSVRRIIVVAVGADR